MKAPTAAAVGALGLAAYAAVEPYLFRSVIHELPVAAPSPELSVLHVSDLHMGSLARNRYRAMSEFLLGLAERTRDLDLVLATGDLIEGNAGIDPVVEMLGAFQARLGKFYVLGSHDYYLSEFQSYVKYFTGRRPVKAAPADTGRLEAGLEDCGWTPLTNSEVVVDSVRLCGVDDPYLRRHRTDHIHRAPDDSCAIGLCHAPDVVSEYALAGFDLVVAGHTHAGQVRVPGLGAVVTNCTLPAALAGGPHKVGGCWLHVSPGLGNGKFAPIRFGARPEITLLRLVPTP